MSLITESETFAPRNALHRRGWGRPHSYSAHRYCNPPSGTQMVRSRLFYDTHHITPDQAKTLLRRKILLGSSFKGVMFLCVNPEFEGVPFDDILAWGGC